MEIVLVNSPESVFSAKRLTSIREGDEITPIGIIQAKLLALRLKEVKFEDIYCSKMSNAKETLKEISIYQKESKVVLMENIEERNYGIMNGKSIRLLNELIDVFNFIIKKRKVPRRKFKPISGESIIDVYVRAQDFLQYLIKTYINPLISFPIFDLFKFNYLEEQSKSNQINIKLNKNENLVFNYKKLIEDSKEIMENISFTSDNSLIESDQISEEFIIQVRKENDEIRKDSESILKMILDFDYENKITKLYKGYQQNEIRRTLVISHSGFIREIINAIKVRQGLNIDDYDEVPLNCSVYIIRAFCPVCVSECEKKDKCKIKFEIMIYNDISHLDTFNQLEAKLKAGNCN